MGASQNVGAGSASDGDMAQDEEACCSVLAHLLVDMWQRAGPAASFSLACILLKRYVNPSGMPCSQKFSTCYSTVCCVEH